MSGFLTFIYALGLLVGSLGLLATLLPLLRQTAWWVRVFDFPRLQIVAGLLLGLLLLQVPGGALALPQVLVAKLLLLAAVIAGVVWLPTEQPRRISFSWLLRCGHMRAGLPYESSDRISRCPAGFLLMRRRRRHAALELGKHTASSSDDGSPSSSESGIGCVFSLS